MHPSLLPFFQPRGVVVIGASHDPAKLGYGLARNLVNSGYTGAIHFVNPRGQRLLDHAVYPTIAAVPDPVDLAVIMIPASAIPDALHACGTRGIRAAIIASGGFRESGRAGAALEQTCLEIARSYAMRLLGPNCVGLLDTHLPIDTTFLPPPGPVSGDVAFISHSGAICEAVIDWAHGQGFGLSRLVSLGNQTDVGESEVLAPVAEDEHTHVLTLYLEGVQDGPRFVAEATQVTRLKPVIALKVGRSKSGQRAVASHTGALAGQETAFNAAFERAGVIRADSTEEMFDWARALAWSPLPRGRAMAVLTNAGGPGAIAADALDTYGLHLADLSAETHSALASFLPTAASLHNPVDILASASPDQYANALHHLLADPGVHGVLVILPPPPMYTAEAVVQAMLPTLRRASKPVMIALMGEKLIRSAAELLREQHIPDYRFPERAASCLAVLAQRAEFLATPPWAYIPFPDCDPEAAQAALADSLPGAWLAPEASARLLHAYGITATPLELAQSAEEAVAIAARQGYPVVLKVASPDLPHKSDVGGILLDVRTPDDVAAGFARVCANARQARPDARVLGVHVQRMVPAGEEVIAGVVRDVQFGPLVMFGAGGVDVEGLKDVAFALAPLTLADAEALLARTWAGRKLAGTRGRAPADRAAVCATLMRLAQLAHDLPQLAEIEINPLRVFAAGAGALALDVRARLVA